VNDIRHNYAIRANVQILKIDSPQDSLDRYKHYIFDIIISMNAENNASLELCELSQDVSTKPRAWSDRLIDGQKPLSAGLKKMAKFIAADVSDELIAKNLLMTVEQVKILRQSTAVKTAVHRFKDSFHEERPEKRIYELAPLALDAIEEMITNPNTPAKVRLAASLWVMRLANMKMTARDWDAGK